MEQKAFMSVQKQVQSSMPAAVGILQRKCDKCRKKEPALKRSAVRDATDFMPPIVHEVLRSPGHPLDLGTRTFFESRFGHDFSRVRIHTDAKAATSAREVNALAYTLGRDIVFGAGTYTPETASGRRLLAHELTHVMQQSDPMQARQVQRWSYGSGAPPHIDYRVVPLDHRPRIEQGMKLLERVVKNPKDFPVCHKFFEANCPGGTPSSLENEFNSATMWFDTDNTVWGSGVEVDQVAYSDATYRMGRWFIGSVMVHELMHRCGQHNESINDEAIPKCGFRDVEIIDGKVVEK